jgi:DNA-binding NarL/FixJ family response regulator
VNVVNMLIEENTLVAAPGGRAPTGGRADRWTAEEMFLSRNTVKTEVNSIYRKLGASTRSQAVTRSRELGLLAG